MLGAIIGDIVGSRFEFNNTDNYNFELFAKDSTFTDDTICTIAIADAINTGESYKDKLLEWCRTYQDLICALSVIAQDFKVMEQKNKLLW